MNRLRTPITYYGGKQKLVNKILENIPFHNLYCEPFLGGAAVFFSKKPSSVEVINDTNRELMNFYKVCRNRFHELSALVRVTLHSRDDHDSAWVIYNKPHLFDEVRRAWAVWVLSTQSFSAMLNGSWGYDSSSNTTSKKIMHKREEFTEELATRLQTAQIECAEAIYIINRCNREDAFIYADPPYFNSCMGHYDGYKESDFIELLETLSKFKGKFLLSSYPSDILKKFVHENNWSQLTIFQNISVNAKSGNLSKKQEVLTANYPLS